METPVAKGFDFHMPTRIVFGDGSLNKLGHIISEKKSSGARIFLVTGKNSLKSQGVLGRIRHYLKGHQITHFDDALPFPSPELVDEAVELCRKSEPDIVVSVGGGSALDLGKLVAILLNNDGTSLEYGQGQKKITNRGLPFIAVPTTSGSSSEVTSGAALWQMDIERSCNINHEYMFPEVALVDPELTFSMPKDLAAATGMDAFTSAFESYWSLESQPPTDSIALKVIELYLQNLENSCINGEREARRNCALAATWSGIGYTNSRPNICHAFSSPLTIFWGVPHGEAVGVSLSSCLSWNIESIERKLTDLWSAMGVNNLDEACSRIQLLISNCGLRTKLKPMGVTTKDLDRIMRCVPWERLGTIPRTMKQPEARTLIESLI